MRLPAVRLALALVAVARGDDPPAKPITPAEAAKKVNEKVTVEFEVRSTVREWDPSDGRLVADLDINPQPGPRGNSTLCAAGVAYRPDGRGTPAAERLLSLAA
jgi:hypothetical protein